MRKVSRFARKASSLLLSAIIMSIAACARNAAPSESTTQQQANAQISARVQAQAQMQRNRDEAHRHMLRALTQEHRELLAQLVGELATSQQPDVAGAVVKLDATLTPNEKQAILDIGAGLRRQYQPTWQGVQQVSDLGVRMQPTRSLKEDPGSALLDLTTQVTFWRTATGIRKPFVQPGSKPH